MKETGIMMSGDHPVKVLKGVKTQTRRTAGLQKINENPDDWYASGFNTFQWYFCNKSSGQVVSIKCPYGQVGDRLWVRETFCVLAGDDEDGDPILYRANPQDENEMDYMVNHGEKVRWHPSIHMFKRDARIWLEITGLRAERLREASLADAIAEGFKTVDELISAVLSLNHLPEDDDPWLWVISFKLLTER